VHASYARGQGAVYAKHLRSGDLRMLYFMGREVYWSAREGIRNSIGRPASPPRRRGELAALAAGFTDYMRSRRRAATEPPRS